ncbi:MAG: hypothetical protein KDD53_13250, partial [Bdellovibrionales bacterium]|nr:hypothetical protein [Bdellovibrionales bacterium]
MSVGLFVALELFSNLDDPWMGNYFFRVSGTEKIAIELTFRNERFDVWVDGFSSKSISLRIDHQNTKRHLNLENIEKSSSGALLVEVQGSTYKSRLLKGVNSYWIVTPWDCAPIGYHDRSLARNLSSKMDSSIEIKAPFPGKVLKVHTPSDQVVSENEI